MAQQWRHANVVTEQAGQQATTATGSGQRNGHGIAHRPRCGGATQFLRVAHAQPAQLGSTRIQAARKLARLFPRFQVRLNFGLDESVRGILQQLDVF